MAVGQRVSLILSDDERAELTSAAMRRKTAPALALRARIVLACAEGAVPTERAAFGTRDSFLGMETPW